MYKLFLLTAFDLFVAFLDSTARLHGPNCLVFGDPYFRDSQAIGVWNLIHFRSEKSNGTGESHCLEISYADKEDVSILRSRVEMYAENTDWDSIKMRMIIPCKELPYKKKKYYYLEKLKSSGAYRTILLPYTDIHNAESLNRNSFRLKVVGEKYLIMLDCDEGYMFVVGREPPTGSLIEKRLAQMVEHSWDD